MKRIETKKIIYSLLVIVIFTFVFILLINKNESINLGDQIEDTFNYRTIYGKQLVIRDLNYAYPKYYVIYFDLDNNFEVQMFNYYSSKNEYESDYKLLINNIIDYDAQSKMLRTLYTKGIGTYDNVMTSLGVILNSNNLRVYE